MYTAEHSCSELIVVELFSPIVQGYYRHIIFLLFALKLGVYISKYSDCLDLKRWYDGKTGYIVLLKLTKVHI